jgi:ribonuclease HI
VTVVHPRFDVYTDGACSGSPGPGGWAWALAKDPTGYWASGSAPSTTNQRMEMTAALEAISQLAPRRLTVVTDSAYVMNCFTDKWYLGWRKRGWVSSQGKPVANRDIWEPLIEFVLANDVKFRKVKGHSGDKMNDYVDDLAVRAKKAIM